MLDLHGVQIRNGFGGDAYNEGAIREMRAAGDDSPGPDNAVLPMTQPLSRTEPMPMTVLSPTVAPCTTALWPMETPSPKVMG